MVIASTIVVLYLLLANTIHLVVLFFGYLNARRHHADHQLEIVRKLAPLRALPGISILIPAYNEEKSIADSVRSILRLDYPGFEVIVCNDGSKDATLARLTEAFELVPVAERRPRRLPSAPLREVYVSARHPNLVVLDKANGGKADALNAAINHASHPLICCVDADSVLESEGLLRAAEPFLEDLENTCAVGGVIRVANGSRIRQGELLDTRVTWRPLGMIQAVEYLRAFLVGRMGLDFFGCNLIVSGAFGIFHREAVIRVGGYSTRTVGEDLDLFVRLRTYALLHGEKQRTAFLPHPVCWTEVPEDLRSLGNQRSRWTQGLGETLWQFRWALFRPWSGKVGWLALPYLWVFELLSAPIELAGYLALGIGGWMGSVSFELAALFLVVTAGYGVLLSLCAIVIEELTFARYSSPVDTAKLFLGALLEPLGFRQLHLWWRTKGIVLRWWLGKKSWGEMRRTGFAPA